MDKLVLERSQPVQGQPVDVVVLWNEEHIGEIHFAFKPWLKFKKLLEKGLELDAREDHALDLKLIVKGINVVAKGEPYPEGKTQTYSGRVSNFEAEDDDDAQDLAAIAAVEAGAMPTTEANEGTVTEGLIRSLRRENADG